MGYQNVYAMPDGIAGWEKAKLPVESGPADG
jgi:rhodanese-related sulfurtransferase